MIVSQNKVHLWRDEDPILADEINVDLSLVVEGSAGVFEWLVRCLGIRGVFPLRFPLKKAQQCRIGLAENRSAEEK